MKLAGGRVRDAPLWGAGLRRPTYRLRSHPRHHTLGHQFDVDAEAGEFQWTRGKAPEGTINLLARAAWTATEKSLARYAVSGRF